MDESRKFIRHPSDIPIEIHLEDIVSHKKEYLNDISLGGLSFKSRIFLDSGTAIRIRIPLVHPIFEATGRVVWCEKKDGYFDAGVEFLEIDVMFRARMVEQVCHIEHYKKEISKEQGRDVSAEEAAIEWIKKYAKKFPEDEEEEENT